MVVLRVRRTLMRRAMSILKALSVPVTYVLSLVRGVIKNADSTFMIEHSFMSPTWVRYGMGCEREFAEYWILRVLNSKSESADKPTVFHREKR
jgi:hypothetical protein